MAIERTTYPHTGIYQRKSSKVVLGADEQTSRDLTELLQGEHQDDTLGLNPMESEIIEFLKAYFRTEMGGSSETFRRETIEWLVQEHVDAQRERVAVSLRDDLSQEKRREGLRNLGKLERAADASEILDLIDGVRLKLRTQPSHRTAIETGFLLGVAYGRFRARAYEANALTGSKALAAASTGGKLVKGRSAADHRKIISEFDRSHLSQRRFLQLHPEYSRSTLQRALKEAKKLDSNPCK
jgi:hypothetical protein